MSSEEVLFTNDDLVRILAGETIELDGLSYRMYTKEEYVERYGPAEPAASNLTAVFAFGVEGGNFDERELAG